MVPAAVITACNVLAHVQDPHDFLNGVEYLLDDNGSFITENHDGTASPAACRSTRFTMSTFVISRWRPLSAAACHARADGGGPAEPVPAHGGSLPGDRDERTPGSEPPGGTGESTACGRSCKPLEGPVYGIGATTRATPLIHYTGIQDRLACVCEVPWSDKIGRCIPGTEILIVDEKKLIEDQPPYALILSWHIADIIMPKIRQMGYRGEFIIPLPEPEIIS